MGFPVWQGAKLWYLLNESLPELRERFPEYSYNTLKSKKRTWTIKLNNGEVEMPPKPKSGEIDNFGEVLKLHNLSPEMAKEFTDQGFHVGYIKNKKGEIEYTIPLPRAKTSRINIDEFPPATPAKITSSRAKPIERDHKVIYVWGDAQIDYRRLDDGTLLPVHDERALAVGRMICKDVQPNLIIDLGDTVDISTISRWSPDSDHYSRTLGPSFQRAHDYYAELKADNPQAEQYVIDSNHVKRLKDFTLKFAPQLYGLKRAGEDDEYPMLTYPYLANLGKLGVKWVSGFPSAELVYGEEYNRPPIVFKHGSNAVSGGSTAAKESKENPENHVVRGDGHKIQSHYRTTRAGNYLGSFMVGVACRTTGEVPSYGSAVDDRNRVVRRQEDWQQGVMVIEDYQGEYMFYQIPINNGVAYFKGKRYEA